MKPRDKGGRDIKGHRFLEINPRHTHRPAQRTLGPAGSGAALGHRGSSLISGQPPAIGTWRGKAPCSTHPHTWTHSVHIHKANEKHILDHSHTHLHMHVLYSLWEDLEVMVRSYKLVVELF